MEIVDENMKTPNKYEVSRAKLLKELPTSALDFEGVQNKSSLFVYTWALGNICYLHIPELQAALV